RRYQPALLCAVAARGEGRARRAGRRPRAGAGVPADRGRPDGHDVRGRPHVAARGDPARADDRCGSARPDRDRGVHPRVRADPDARPAGRGRALPGPHRRRPRPVANRGRTVRERRHAAVPRAGTGECRGAVRAGRRHGPGARAGGGMSAAVPGRSAELERLLERVRDTAAGRGAVVLIEGEPGIGKTTLLDAVADRATRSGVRVRRGAGEQRQAPFAAITRCLGMDPPSDEPEFVITEAILDRVETWTAGRPVLLVIDDLHRIDPASLVALSRLGRAVDRLALVIVAAHRPMARDEALGTLLAALDALVTESLTLGPL